MDTLEFREIAGAYREPQDDESAERCRARLRDYFNRCATKRGSKHEAASSRCPVRVGFRHRAYRVAMSRRSIEDMQEGNL